MSIVILPSKTIDPAVIWTTLQSRWSVSQRHFEECPPLVVDDDASKGKVGLPCHVPSPSHRFAHGVIEIGKLETCLVHQSHLTALEMKKVPRDFGPPFPDDT